MKDWLTESVSVLRANLAAFYTFALLAETVSAIILEISGMGPALRGAMAGGNAPPQGPVTPVAVLESAPGGLLGGLGILLIATVPPLAFTVGSIAHGVLRYLDGDPATVGECLTAVRDKAAGLVTAGVIAWIGVFLGLMLFFIPGIVVFAFLFLTWPVLMAEETGPVRALQRSGALTRGIRFHIVGVYGFLILALLVAGEIVATILSGTGIVGMLALMLLQALFVAFGATLASIIYRTQRRKLGQGGSPA